MCITASWNTNSYVNNSGINYIPVLPPKIATPNGFSITRSSFVRSNLIPFCISMLQKYYSCSPINKSFLMGNKSSTLNVGKYISCLYWYFYGYLNIGTHIFYTLRLWSDDEFIEFFRYVDKYCLFESFMVINSFAAKNTTTTPLY